MVQLFEFGNLVRKYQKDTIGKGWQAWWKYKSHFNSNPYKLFEDDQLLRTSYYLYNYMVMFGMSKGYLSDILPDDFITSTAFYGQILKKYRILEIGISSVTDINCHHEQIDKVFDELYNSTHGFTLTFVSKMLMALWGHTIAWDKNFSKTFYLLFKEKYTKRQIDNLEWSTMFEMLFDKHAIELSALNEHEQLLYPERIHVPKMRLIDMAYWQFGHDFL